MVSSKILFYLVLLQVLTQCFAIKFEIMANRERCLKQDFKIDDLVSGSVSIQPAIPDMDFTIRILDSESHAIYENRDILEAAKFAFTADTETEYSFCFVDIPKTRAANQGQKRWITLKIQTGEKKKDYDEIARREQLMPIERELRKIADLSSDLKQDFVYAKNREARHRDTSESTNSRVAVMSFLSLGILLSLGVAQAYYMKRYFVSKRMI